MPNAGQVNKCMVAGWRINICDPLAVREDCIAGDGRGLDLGSRLCQVQSDRDPANNFFSSVSLASLPGDQDGAILRSRVHTYVHGRVWQS